MIISEVDASIYFLRISKWIKKNFKPRIVLIVIFNYYFLLTIYGVTQKKRWGFGI